MPSTKWTKKRQRQYEHVKDSLKGRGRPTEQAEEIAARTVNKERAREGESRTASRSSVQDMSSSKRGGLRSHTRTGGPTKSQLYNEARQKRIAGRSRMRKAELSQILGKG